MLEIATERRERLDPGRGLAVRCALTLGVRREVVSRVLADGGEEQTALGWMRALLEAEEQAQD